MSETCQRVHELKGRMENFFDNWYISRALLLVDKRVLLKYRRIDDVTE